MREQILLHYPGADVISIPNADGKAFIPTGGSLKDIARLDLDGMDSRLDGVEITAMCGIDNPMYGSTGAAAVFGPQKGADAVMVEELDAGIISINRVAVDFKTARLRSKEDLRLTMDNFMRMYIIITNK